LSCRNRAADDQLQARPEHNGGGPARLIGRLTKS
jgi:hypothetical protein